MKQQSRFLCFAFAVTCLGLISGYLLSPTTWSGGPHVITRVFANQKKFVPRTVLLLETSIDGAGNTVKVSHLEALSSDGSLVRIYETIDPKTGETRNKHRKLLLSNRLKLDILDSIRAKSTLRSAEHDFAVHHLGAMRTVSTECIGTVDGSNMEAEVGESLVGREMIQGISAVKIQTKDPKILSWYSLDHGCALIGQEVHYTYPAPNESNKRMEGISTKRLAFISGTEPDPKLFEIPADYEELPPSKLFIKSAAKILGVEKDCNPEASAAEDRKYYAQRP